MSRNRVVYTPEQRQQAARHLAEGYPLNVVAERTGVGRSTLGDWNVDPAFRAMIREARTAMFAPAEGRAAALLVDSIEVLGSIAGDEKEAASNRVRAANGLATIALKLREQGDLRLEIERLKAAAGLEN